MAAAAANGSLLWATSMRRSLLRPRVSASVATQLSFVAGLAVQDAVAAHLPADQLPRLRLKWPNDVMLGAAKLAGILLESLPSPKRKGLAVILGMGINVTFAPTGTERAVASLGLEPADVPRVFAKLASALDTWLARWDEGRNFPGNPRSLAGPRAFVERIDQCEFERVRNSR